MSTVRHGFEWILEGRQPRSVLGDGLSCLSWPLISAFDCAPLWGHRQSVPHDFSLWYVEYFDSSLIRGFNVSFCQMLTTLPSCIYTYMYLLCSCESLLCFGGWCSLKWRWPIDAILDEEINSQPRAVLHRDIESIMRTKSLQWSGGQAESQRGRLAVVAWLTVGPGQARRGWTHCSRWVPPPVLFLSACFGVLLTFCEFMNLGSDDTTLLRSLCSVKVCVVDICFAVVLVLAPLQQYLKVKERLWLASETCSILVLPLAVPLFFPCVALGKSLDPLVSYLQRGWGSKIVCFPQRIVQGIDCTWQLKCRDPTARLYWHMNLL